MTSPHDSHSAHDRSSASSSSSHPPTSSSSSRRGLAPLSTSLSSLSSKPPTVSSQSPRNPWSPAPNAATGPSLILSRNATRSSSVSTSNSPFAPPQPGQSNPSPGVSSRTRTPTSGSTASAAQATGGGSSATARISRNSHSLSHGSPPNLSSGSDSSSSVSSIVIAQVTVLLSSLKDRDKDKWESQVDQLRKLVDTHGMEVFTKYFRRLILSNSSQIWHNSRSFDNGTYRVLESEVQKISTDPFQASKIVESIEQGEKDGDVFRDFDLSGFMDHFKMKTLAKVALAAAFKKASKTDLRTKADAILFNNLNQFIASLASPTSPEAVNDQHTTVLASIIAHLAQYPPRSWSPDMLQNLDVAIQRRFNDANRQIPLEISSTMMLFDILDPNNHLVCSILKAGPRGTDNIDKCQAALETVELHDISYEQVSNVLLFMACINAIQEPAYSPSVFISALREHRAGQRLDWMDVLHGFDCHGVKVTKRQFKVLFDALLPIAREYENFDLQLLWGGHWRHQESQLTFVSAFLSCSQDEVDASKIPRLRKAFTIEDFQDAPAEVQNYAADAVRHPLVSLDGTEALFGMVFRSSDTYSHAQTLGVIENVINPRMDLFVAAVSAVQKPWGPLQDQAVKQLLSTLLLNRFGGNDFVFHILWKRDPTWLVVRLRQFWQQDPKNLERILEHAREHGWLDHLIAVKDDLSLELAALAHGRGFFSLEPWLEELSQSLPTPKVVNIFCLWLRNKAQEEILVHREQTDASVPSLQVKTVHAVLKFLGDAGLLEDELITLQRECIQAYPRLINYGEGFDAIIDANNAAGNELPPEADEKMQEHYKHMYNDDSQVRDVVEVLHKYKTSEDSNDQDLFACMIYGLFDEYNCFPEYPMEALAITAVLFGSIINFNLLSRIALKAALSMVLESVRDHAPGEPMYRFGLQALLHFQDRLPEWKMFSERLLQVPGLRGTEIEEVVERIVRESKDAPNGEGQSTEPGEATVDDFLATESKTPEFTCLAVDNLQRNDYEEPEESVKENVLFTLNNLSERNLTTKFPELKEGLQQQHHQWLANYLVDQRVKSQPNFQKLYMDLLDQFNDRELWAEVLRETYLCSFKLLNAESTATSPSERTSLRNMADWLGSITLARSKPIKFRNLSFKDLLIEAHDTNRLPLAVPFTCRVLAKAAESSVFKPPCAWTAEILEILVELHRFVEMKVQHKFEIERLLSDLGVDEKGIEPSTAVRDRPPQEEAALLSVGPSAADGLSDAPQVGFPRGPTERYSPATVVPELSDIGSMLKHNYTLAHLTPGTQQRLRQVLTGAVDRAINEIIGPVVDRSVTIAAISASQLISKDFATEPDAARYQDSAHNLVRNLAGSLALVTCKEPLRSSIGANIRSALNAELGDQALSEGAILMFVNDNLEAVCSLVEKAAENVSSNEIDYYIEPAVQARKNGNFMETPINRWSYHVPEPFKPSHGGLNQDQLAIYEEFGRALRGNISHSINASQDAGRQLPDVLQDQFSAISAIPNHGDASSMLRQGISHSNNQILQGQARPQQHMVNGYSDVASLSDRVHQLALELIRTASAGAEEFPDVDLASLSSVHGAWRRLQGFIFSSGQISQQEHVTLVAAEQLAQVLYREPLQPAAVDILAKVVTLLCDNSDMTMREVCTWIRASEERIYNPVCTVAFLKANLLDYGYVDKLVASAMAQGRADIVAFFGKIVDGILLSEPPFALRADFAHSMTALAKWSNERPDDSGARDISQKLQDATILPRSTHPASPAAEAAQMEYIFEEWTKLQHGDSPPGSLVSFIQQLHAQRTIATRDSLTLFVRICINDAINAFDGECAKHVTNVEHAYLKADSLSKLVVLAVAHQGQTNGDVKMDRMSFFKHVISTTVFVLADHLRAKAELLNQKLVFRIFSGLMCEMGASFKLTTAEVLDMTIAIGRGLLLLQPTVFPAVAFTWTSVISHRLFMPVLLRSSNEAAVKLCCELLTKHLEYVGTLLSSYDVSRAAKDLYRGTLEVLLMLHHDLPEFLAENHTQLLCSVPLHCTQLRSLIVSASPASSTDVHDPFSGGFQLDRLEDNRRPPVVHGSFAQSLQETGIKDDVDSFLRSPSQDVQIVENILNASKLTTKSIHISGAHVEELDDTLFNALVLYLVSHTEVVGQQNMASFVASSPEGKLMDVLCEQLPPAGRYHLIGAIVNQLRWPNQHTYYCSYMIFHLFRARQSEQLSMEIQTQAARVLLERLVAHRPHPWGLMVVMEELLKNRLYGFWELPFIKQAPEIERMFSSLFQQMSQHQRALA